ncbi:hypothetical protein LOD99_4922 [Oopsacas minuta]|uniref:Uncharacterized protein n=1 Tax=Oopsacas minuta TaxID=111878 RepID=A0AAV7JRZ5_9METZ|nr:hypothetical protein LOD99_4922 [Oopsacas minuta]
MAESDEILRHQIVRLEGSLQNARDRNTKVSKGMKGNYADLSLVLADASQQMDYDRFNIKWNESDKPGSAEQQSPSDGQVVKLPPSKDKIEIEALDDEIDRAMNPSIALGRFGAKMPNLNERESERDLRDFNDLVAPEEDTTHIIQQEHNTGYLRDLSSDRSEDYDYNTPQQEDINPHVLNQNYTEQLSEDYETNASDDVEPFRARLRSKTDSENQKEQHRSSRSRSEVEALDESLYYDNPMRIYPRDQPERDGYNVVSDDITNELSPIIDDDDTIYDVTDEVSPNEDDYDLNKAISTLEESDVRYTTKTNRNSRLNIMQPVEINRSDSDSEYDNFINQHQEVMIQPPQEEMRATSPYYHPRISKSSLGTYTEVDRSVSPKNIIMRKHRQQESQKRLTMPAQAMDNYEECVSRTPGPYPKSKISITTPQPNLTFRPVQSAKDVLPYETVFSNRRKSIPDYISDEVCYEQEEYAPVEEKHVHRRPAQQSLNRNSRDNRHYVAYTRQDMVSPTSPLQEAAYDTHISYETSVDSSVIMNTRQPTEYHTRNHYATPIQYNNQRRQYPTRNAYAPPHGNLTNSIGRNHGYIPNNDPSPVQSLDSGIDSLFNDVSYRPGTAAANTNQYYNDEFRDYDESQKDSLTDMEDIVSQLRKELKVLTTKVNNFESRGVAPTLPGPPPSNQLRVMSPTNQKYRSYSPNQLRSTSVASSGSEGGRIVHDSRSPQVISPTSPVHSYHSNTMPKQPRLRAEDRREYAPFPRDSTYKRKLVQTQNSTPVPVAPRPKTVSKITSNNTMQDRNNSRITQHPITVGAMHNRTTTNRTYTPNLPRAQSSTGTFYGPVQSSRLQTSRFKAAPQTNRSVSPQPKTSARKITAPITTRAIYSSQSHRTSDGHYYNELPSRIPKSNQRHY